MPCASCAPGRSSLRRSVRNAGKRAAIPSSSASVLQKAPLPSKCHDIPLGIDDDDLSRTKCRGSGLTTDMFPLARPSTSKIDPFGAASSKGRKRAQETDSQVEELKEETSAQYQLHTLPDDVLLTIFNYLSEKDLCRTSQVCKRFQTLTDDLELWRKLYQALYEYDLPLFHPESCRFVFESVSDCLLTNPWKESFQQLYRGVHVRPGYQTCTFADSNIQFFNTIESALDHVVKNSDRLSSSHGDGPLVFIHSGTYLEECIVIDYDISIIGAAPGIVSHSVILDRCNESTLVFVEGAKRAYAGHMTLKFFNGGPLGPPFAPPPPHPLGPIGPPDAMLPMELMLPVMLMGSHASHSRHCCIDINENSCPVIDSCLIWSNSTVGAAIFVNGMGANPTIKHCVISHCANVGLCVTDYAQGIYEDNEVCNNFLAGILVRNGANPIMRRNHIHHGRDVGILMFDNGMGYFDNNDIHSNCNAAIEVKGEANPTVVNCEIHHGPKWGVCIHGSGRGQFMYNKIHSFDFAGVWITSTKNPTVRRNEIYNCRQGGVYIYEGRALIEYNNIYGDALPGIQITSTGHPIIRYNNIYSTF